MRRGHLFCSWILSYFILFFTKELYQLWFVVVFLLCCCFYWKGWENVLVKLLILITKRKRRRPISPEVLMSTLWKWGEGALGSELPRVIQHKAENCSTKKHTAVLSPDCFNLLLRRYKNLMLRLKFINCLLL